MDRREYHALHRLMRLFQVKNRFVGNAFRTDLTLAESHLLTDLAMDPGSSSAALAAALQLSPTAVSRLIAGLAARRLLKVQPHPQDRRRKLLLMTAAGMQVLTDLDRRSEELLAGFCSALHAPEIERLVTLLHKLADGFGAPALPYTRREHPLRPPIRRLTRILGLLSDSVFHASGLASLEWHILTAIEDGAGRVTARDLCRRFFVAPNTMSGITGRLVRRNLVTRAPAETDRRQLVLRPTVSGQRLIGATEQSAVRELQQAMRSFSEDEAAELLRIFARFCGEQSEFIIRGEAWQMRQLEQAEERAAARALVMRTLVRARKEELAPETLFAGACFAWGLFSSGARLGAAAEVQPLPGGRTWRLVNLAFTEEIDETGTTAAFIEASIRQCFAATAARRVVVQKGWLPRAVRCSEWLNENNEYVISRRDTEW